MYNRHERNQNRRIKNVEKNIRKMKAEEELKYHELNIVLNPILVTGTLFVLNGIAQGGGQNQREGAQISTSSLKVDLWLDTNFNNYGAAVHRSQQMIRILIFWDSQPNGADPPLLGDPFSNTIGVLDTRVTGNPIIAPYMTESNVRFRFLYDRVFDMNANFGFASEAGEPPTAVTYYGAPKFFHFKKKFRLGRVTQYLGTGSGIAAINKNSLFLAVISKEPSISSMTGSFKVFYKDD